MTLIMKGPAQQSMQSAAATEGTISRILIDVLKSLRVLSESFGRRRVWLKGLPKRHKHQ